MNNSFDYFDKIYCINLQKRKDRWENSFSQFLNLKIEGKVKRKEGVVCDMPNLSQKQRAQIGCTLSHYSILQEAKKNGFSKILVLEDDFLFLGSENEINLTLKNCLEELPEDWDLFYFGAFFVKGYDYEPLEIYSDNLIKVNTGFCTHAICYSKNAIDKILNNLKLETVNQILDFSENYEVIDWYLVKEFQNENKCFAPKDLLCIQKEGFSDIENKYFNYEGKFSESYNFYLRNNFALSC